jgi:hypothetical protein
MRESEQPFLYSLAERCPADDMRAIIPDRELADTFVRESGGTLAVVPCTEGHGLHLVRAPHPPSH